MKKYLFSIICTLLPMIAWAQEPYAIMIDENTAIEFRYDNNRSSYPNAMDIGPFTSTADRGWNSMVNSIYSVVFDQSFASCTSITSTEYWFFGCTHLETFIGLEYLNTSNVTNMASMFHGCTNLTSLDLSSFNTSNVTEMKMMFYECPNLTTIAVSSGWSTANVSSSDYMFEGCTSLVGGSGTTYDSSHTDASYAHVDGGSSNPGYLSGESGEEAQYWMELMSTLQYADDVYARADGNSNVEPWMLEELSDFMNRGSDMLDERTAEKEEVHHMIEEINWICWEIEEAMNREPEPSGEAEPYAVLSDNNTVLTFYYDDQKSARGGMDVGPFADETERGWHSVTKDITQVIIDGSMANNTTLTSTAYWFEDFFAITGFDGLENLNTINVTNMNSMFNGCIKITSLSIPFSTVNVTDMGEMFHAMDALVTLDVSGMVTDNVTAMNHMFTGDVNLRNLDVTKFNTSKVEDMDLMFSYCKSLESINLSHFSTASVTNLYGMFDSCSSLTSLDLSTFDTQNVERMSFMFQNCSSLTTLDLSSFDVQKVTDVNSMFNGCSQLHTIYVNNRWNLASLLENEWARSDVFTNCTNLVGGAGTAYDADHVDADYAHIDGGVDNPGYLTDGRGGGEGEARFDGLTAWVSGDKTLDDAFAEVGREAAVQTIAAIVWNGDGALTADQMQGITNPNLLVYVNEASKAPAGVQNIIVNGSAAQIVLTDASGNNNFHCPQSFTAQSISYTRNFSQTTEIGVCRGWETIALPFNVQSISHSHGALVPFGGGNGGYPFWLHQLQDNSLSPVTVMEANTPYLICMPNNKVYPSAYNQAGNVTFASSNVTVPETHPHEGFAGNVMLIPAFQSVEASPDIYTLNVGEASGSYAEGSVFISNYRSVRPFQAYTVHTNGARGEDIRYIPLTTLGGGTDGTTGIMEILQLVGNDAGAWYSLDGRKLDAKPTRKGVYIQNGKKIVLK